jgi:hypothetical protein
MSGPVSSKLAVFHQYFKPALFPMFTTDLCLESFVIEHLLYLILIFGSCK